MTATDRKIQDATPAGFFSQNYGGFLTFTYADDIEDQASTDGGQVAQAWCHCGADITEHPPVYWEHKSGGHGWACSCCRGITQTG